MKYALMLAGLVVSTFSNQARAQGVELVPNGGFETISAEARTWDQVHLAEGWDNATLGMSELFSKSAPAKTVGIPDNEYGSCYPFEGEHLAGFHAWKDDVRFDWGSSDPEELFKPGWNLYAEYMQYELKQALFEGRTYEVVFHIRLSNNSDRAVSGIGAYFGPEKLKYYHRHYLAEKPVVYTETITKDKENWTEVRGTFVADGGESWLCIGTFPHAGMDQVKIIEGLDNKYAYYYIDGISVKEVPAEK
ncbi:MAG: hypothetical protein WAU70_14430 [Flavobacteriales bacterium]